MVGSTKDEQELFHRIIYPPLAKSDLRIYMFITISRWTISGVFRLPTVTQGLTANSDQLAYARIHNPVTTQNIFMNRVQHYDESNTTPLGVSSSGEKNGKGFSLKRVFRRIFSIGMLMPVLLVTQIVITVS